MRRGRLELADRPIIREHRQDGVDGAVTLMGVKYTTARAAAQYAVTLAMAQIGGRPGRSRTASLSLPGMVPSEHRADGACRGLDAGVWAASCSGSTAATRVASRRWPSHDPTSRSGSRP